VTLSTRYGRYEVKRKIGTGGVATVYLATDTLLGRSVAIKVLNPDVDPGLKRRFLSEARAVAVLNHPNIVDVYDVGEEDGTPFIVMEYVDGQSLKEFIKNQGRLPLERAKAIVSQVADALSYAHKNKIIHCDVKPQNILISKDGRAKLVDFGIAQAQIDSTQTSSGRAYGTPLYMAPEQLLGDKVDERTDIYSLGLVLWECITGTPPQRSQVWEPVRLDQGKVRLPPEVLKIIKKATSQLPEDRYQSVDAFLRDLQNLPPRSATAFSQESTVTIPTGFVPKNGITNRRRRRIRALPIALLLVMLIIAVTLWRWPDVYSLGRGLSSGALTSSDVKVTVPSFVGMSLRSARQLAQRSDIQLRVRYEDGRAGSVVVSQSPPPGEKVDKGSYVTVVLSSQKGTSENAPSGSPTPNIEPVPGKIFGQLLATNNVHVKTTVDGDTNEFDLLPGEYRQLAANTYLRIEANPARDLMVTITTASGKRSGNLLDLASQLSGESIAGPSAWISFGSENDTNNEQSISPSKQGPIVQFEQKGSKNSKDLPKPPKPPKPEKEGPKR